MVAGPTRGDLRVTQGQPAEGHKQPGVANDAFPVGHPASHWRVGADHMRQQELRRTPAVVARLIDAAATGIQKAMRQRTRMVQAPGRRPAVGTTEDGFTAILTAHPFQLASDELKCRVPADLDERIAAARAAVAVFPLRQPAFAHGWLAYAQRGVHHAGHGL